MCNNVSTYTTIKTVNTQHFIIVYLNSYIFQVYETASGFMIQQCKKEIL
jgi:hypothetical protein